MDCHRCDRELNAALIDGMIGDIRETYSVSIRIYAKCLRDAVSSISGGTKRRNVPCRTIDIIQTRRYTVHNNETSTTSAGLSGHNQPSINMESPTPHVPSHLQPPPRTKKRAISTCRCLTYTILTLLALIFIFLLASLGWAFKQQYHDARDPHRSHRLPFNESLSLGHTRSKDYVTPIIGQEDTYDVLISVWVALPNSEQEEGFNGTMRDKTEGQTGRTHGEECLFSEVVYKGLGLESGTVVRDVQYRLPLKRL